MRSVKWTSKVMDSPYSAKLVSVPSVTKRAGTFHRLNVRHGPGSSPILRRYLNGFCRAIFRQSSEVNGVWSDLDIGSDWVRVVQPFPVGKGLLGVIWTMQVVIRAGAETEDGKCGEEKTIH